MSNKFKNLVKNCTNVLCTHQKYMAKPQFILKVLLSVINFICSGYCLYLLQKQFVQSKVSFFSKYNFFLKRTHRNYFSVIECFSS